MDIKIFVKCVALALLATGAEIETAHLLHTEQPITHSVRY